GRCCDVPNACSGRWCRDHAQCC
uniref:Mu-conotoxin CnIIIA n=1 Tax=Conus consors TaxID=101297 RepID=CM3A_CONCN|nr:RecName: Full=Mu-conotoxin CnIIIA [Conus consors]